MQHQIRQGDVLVMQVKQIPKRAQAIAPKNGKVVAAEGEVTGHAHVLPAKHVREFQSIGELNDVDRYVTVDRLSELTHEEHGTLHAIPGHHEIRLPEQYTPSAIVRDLD